MAHRRTARSPLLGMAIAALCLSGCGGGNAGTQPVVQSTVLEWDPPGVAADSSPMDPQRDLDYYELYLRTDPNFGDGDLPVAQIASFTDVLSPNGRSFTRELTKEFVLENLLPFIDKGKRYYVSIRAVGVDGLKSGFMVPIAWDLS